MTPTAAGAPARTEPAPMTRRSFQSAPLAEQFRHVRAFTESLCAPLATEDFVVQSMTDVSPTKWHLAHTTWFWEAFVLAEHLPGYELYDPDYHYLFNSYYVQAGPRHCRDQRGYLSRPTVVEVMAFRSHVDAQMERLLGDLQAGDNPALTQVFLVALNHEQQHQELILTDIKHVLSVNPLRPAYRSAEHLPAPPADAMRWVEFGEGVRSIGYDPEADGAYFLDNEGPRHRVFLEPFALADRLVTCGEYLEFMEAGGYDDEPLWLTEGFATAKAQSWRHPFYWESRDGEWWHFTLGGMRRVDPNEPVTHLSYFEADAYTRWAGRRLPTEFEWEVAARSVARGGDPAGNFAEAGTLHPSAPDLGHAGDGAGGLPTVRQLFGDAWEWTLSHYSPYPGYRPEPGALGEYNGKWMCNQFVLRGGSCATSRTHIRASYRNFFHPAATWQFTGLRLARSIDPADR